jgi:MFS family permease
VTIYIDILRSRYVSALVLSSLLARLPVGINALAIVLYLREQTGSFAIAGAVSGTLAAGSGIGAPVQGRLVDRIGARRVLVPLACVHAVGLGAIVAFAELGEPTALLLLCGFVAGFAVPPTSSVLRSLWPDLLEPRLHRTAYALDSTLIEVIFISGPLLTAIIAALTSPAGALIISAISVVVGTTIFTALPPTQHVEPEHRAPGGLLGALASPGVRALVLMSLPTGVGIGMLEVGIPAFSRAEGAAPAAGALLALWSFGSLVGGLLYGTLPRRRGLFQTHLIVGSLLPLTLLPLAIAPSVWVMALLVIPAGCCIAPLLATRNELVAGVAPPGMRIEAYTWPITAFVGGIAGGAALCGALVEGPGWRSAFVVAAIFAAGGAVLAAVWRKTVQPRVPVTP